MDWDAGSFERFPPVDESLDEAWPGDCPCGASEPDEFGNRDLLVSESCRWHGGGEA